MTGELPCELVLQGITDYMEDAAAPPVRRACGAHLRRCPRCSLHLRELRGTLRLLRDRPPETMPEHRKRVLLDAFRGWPRAS